MTNGGRASAPHVVVGLCFMLLGGTLVLDKLGMLDARDTLQFWPIGLVLLGGGMMVQALTASPDGKRRADFPFGGLVWLVLLGLFFTWTFERRSSADGSGGPATNLFALMSEDQRAPQEAFHGGRMTSFMGGTQLDLRQAKLAPGQSAVVDVFSLMGGAVIFVPKDWKVDMDATAVMGGIQDERFQPPTPRRRRGGRGERSGGPDFDVPEPPDLPDLPDLPGDDVPEPPTPPSAAELDKIERDDPPGLAPDAPKLIVRGVVIMGGLVIKP